VKIEEQVVAWLAKQDMAVYMVGGCVRDRLLGRPVYDLDLAVAGNGLVLARRLADQFRGAYYPLDETRSTGRAILVAPEGHRLVIDVARFRGADPAHSRPATQELAADLDDRDFTINALAADVRAPGVVIDRHGGIADLDAGLIRPVSEESLRNDPLRALRAVRLSATLGFSLAEETRALILRDGRGLTGVSPERVRDELARLLSVPRSADYLCELDNLGLLVLVFPELEPLRGVAQSAPHHLDVLGHSLETVSCLEAILGALDCSGGVGAKDEGSETGDIRPVAGSDRIEHNDMNLVSSLRLEKLVPYAERLQMHLSQRLGQGRARLVTLKLAALLHDAGKPAARSTEEDGRIRSIGHEVKSAVITADVLRRLRFGRTEVRLARAIVGHHTRPLMLANQERVSSRAVYRFFRDTGEAGVDVLLHALADNRAKRSPSTDDLPWLRLVSLAARMLADYYERPAERVDPPLLLDGDDLMRELDLPPGPQIGRLLELVREAQVSGEVYTREDALALARGRLSERG
jgi:poly(A) polymerase